MTWAQYWDESPQIALWYRQADDLRKKRKNEELWLSGIYVSEALMATVGNIFSKNRKRRYPAEPLPITRIELEEKREREQKAKMERIKAAFTARALSINSKIGGGKDD